MPFATKTAREKLEPLGKTGYRNSLRDLLVTMLIPHVDSAGLGKIISNQEYDFGGHAQSPDISFIGSENRHLFDPARRIQQFVPDLAIEIVSEHDSFSSLIRKTGGYREHGVKEVWILSPDTGHAFVRCDDRQPLLNADQTLESKLLPGFSVRLSDLFDRA